MHLVLKITALILACSAPQGAHSWVAVPTLGFPHHLHLRNCEARLGPAVATGSSALTRISALGGKRLASLCRLTAKMSEFGEEGNEGEEDRPGDLDYGDKGASVQAGAGQGGNVASKEEDYICPGTWHLESEVDCEETAVQARYMSEYMIVLNRNGTFVAAVEPREMGQPWSEYNQDERHSIKGIWKKREGHPVSEITLTLFQHAATNRELVLAGKKDGDKCGTLFKGSVLEGIRDPVCIGKWKMRMVTRDFDLIPVSSDICPDDFYGYKI